MLVRIPLEIHPFHFQCNAKNDFANWQFHIILRVSLHGLCQFELSDASIALVGFSNCSKVKIEVNLFKEKLLGPTILVIFRIKDIEHEMDVDEEVRRLESKDPSLTELPSNYTIKFPNMFKLAKKLELATGMNITMRHSSTPFQAMHHPCLTSLALNWWYLT